MLPTIRAALRADIANIGHVLGCSQGKAANPLLAAPDAQMPTVRFSVVIGCLMIERCKVDMCSVPSKEATACSVT